MRCLAHIHLAKNKVPLLSTPTCHNNDKRSPSSKPGTGSKASHRLFLPWQSWGVVQHYSAKYYRFAENTVKTAFSRQIYDGSGFVFIIFFQDLPLSEYSVDGGHARTLTILVKKYPFFSVCFQSHTLVLSGEHCMRKVQLFNTYSWCRT